MGWRGGCNDTLWDAWLSRGEGSSGKAAWSGWPGAGPGQMDGFPRVICGKDLWANGTARWRPGQLGPGYGTQELWDLGGVPGGVSYEGFPIGVSCRARHTNSDLGAGTYGTG